MLKAHSIKTDNANVPHKVKLRQEAVSLVKGPLRVLDLFAGKNVLWGNFETEKYYGIEIVKGKGKNLNSDNVKVIPSLDLRQYNLIDCDSYGIPFAQIEALYKNPTLQKGTVIVYTCIGNAMSGLSKIALHQFGIDKMYRKCKTLFNKRSEAFFYAWLANHEITEVREYEELSSQFNKKYGYFIVK